jgi:tetratricopeptide (TPR) repeat protein
MFAAALQQLTYDWNSMILRSALSALVIFAVSAPANAGIQNTTSFAGNYLAGRTAAWLRDNEAAVDFYSAALNQDAANPVMVERLFQYQLSGGDVAKAEAMASQVIAFNSQHRMARTTLGLKDFRNQHYAEARANFSEAAYTPVGELTSALLTAWTYAGEGSLNAALKALDKLDTLDAFANYKALHSALIEDFLGSGVRAEASYKKAYAQAGTSLRVVQAYGNFLERNGHSDQAIKVYSAFLQNGQNNVLVQDALADAKAGKKPQAFIATPGAGAGEVLFSLAAALSGEQSADAAIMYAQLALSFNADSPVIQSLLGDIYTDQKSHQLAIDAYEHIPPVSPLRIYADTQIAINLQRMERGKEAVERLQAVIKREPKNLDAWSTLGSIYRSNNEDAKAADAYTEALGLLPPAEKNNWQIHYYRGITYDHQKMWDKSDADFRQALAISKDEPTVLNYLGYSLIDRGVKLDEAIAMVKKAVELRPNDGYIVDSLGWAYYTMGDYEQAVNYLERAVDLNPADAVIAEHLGSAYWRVGRKIEARFQWQHAKDNNPEPEDLKRIEGELKDGLADPPKVKAADGKPVVKQ